MSENPTLRRQTQLRLFRPEPKTPAWRMMPVDARREVKALLVLLLRENREARLEINRRQEARDE